MFLLPLSSGQREAYRIIDVFVIHSLHLVIHGVSVHPSGGSDQMPVSEISVHISKSEEKRVFSG
jgi:hypothetical protein